MSDAGDTEAPVVAETARGRHSIWRPRRPVGAPAERALMFRRAAVTLLLLALAVCFYIVLVAPYDHPQLRVATLATVSPPNESSRLNHASSGSPFIEQDIAAWRALSEQLAPEAGDSALLEVPTPNVASDLEGIGERLDDSGIGPRDVLLFYVRSEGVVRQGEPHLLCRGAGASESTYPLTRLLKQLRDRPYAAKLLVLDAGLTEADPQQGVLINEFARLAEQEIRDTDDSTLWVLLSQGVLESSQVLWSRQRTVLTDVLTRGISGEADRNRDREISIDELYRYSANSARQITVLLSDGQANQSPQLYWGGGDVALGHVSPVLAPVSRRNLIPTEQTGADGVAEKPDGGSGPGVNPFSAAGVTPPAATVYASPTGVNLSLTRPSRPSLPTSSSLSTTSLTAAAANRSATATAPAAAAPSTTEPATPPQPAAATPDAAAAAASPAADSPNGTASAADEAASTSPSDDAAGLLMQIWALRDRLEERAELPVSPIDVAPLQWRMLVDDIQQRELQYRTAAVSEPDAFSAELRQLVEVLTDVLEGRRRVSFPRERNSLWEALASSTALPPIQPHSLALAMTLSERGGGALPVELTTAWDGLEAALAADDRLAFDAWLQALPAEFSELVEFDSARRLGTIGELEWPLLALALRARCDGERAAAQWETAPMVREPAVQGDQLLLAAEQMLIDGVDPQRFSRARALLVQASVLYAAAIENGELLARARRLSRDLSYQAPDYVAWWADTGLAMYRCGPTASDVAALLSELQQLGVLLSSGEPADRDEIVIRAGLLEGIADRISAAGCASRVNRARRADLSRETPWHIQTILNTSLPRAAHRLQLLQQITEIEILRLASAPSEVPAAPVPAPTLSLRDWKFLETHAGFQLELARLAAAGLPDGDELLEPLAAVAKATTLDRQAPREGAYATEDDRLSRYRQLETAFSGFYSTLPDAIESASLQVQSGTSRSLDARLLDLEGILQSQRFLCSYQDSVIAGGELPRWQAAELLAYEAQRAEAATTNADAGRANLFRSAARRLLEQSGQLTGIVRTPVSPASRVVISAPIDVSLIEPEQDVDVSIATPMQSATEAWLVLEYDPDIISITEPAGMRIYHEPQLAAEYGVRRGPAVDRRPAAGSLADVRGPPLPPPDGSYTGTWWAPQLMESAAPSVTLSNRGPLTFTLHVERLTPAVRPTRLVVKVLTADHFARGAVEFRTPRPPFADLQFTGGAGTLEPIPQGTVLHPFPNQETEYRFKLQNLGAAARVVDFRLLALSAPLDWDLPVGTLTSDQAAAVLERLPAGAAVAVLEQKPLLPAGAPAVPAAAAAEDPPPAPGAEPPLPSLLHGGVAVITDHETGDTVFVRVDVETQRPVRYLQPQVHYDLVRERVEIVVRAESPDVMPPGGSTVRAEFAEPLDVTATFVLDGVLRAPEHMARLYADVASAPGKVVHLKLHVDGYPRAFLYRILCDRDASGVPATTDALSVAVLQPDPGTAFQTPLSGVPVLLQMDVPHGAFRTLSTVAEVGLDVNRDRFLLNEPVLRLRSDRQVDVRLKKFKPDGNFVLKTSVADFSVTIPATGLGTARVNVLGRVQVDGALAWSEPREIVLDGAAPRIDMVELVPGRALSSEDKLQVVTRVDDRTESGTAKVELAFDLTRSGEFSPDAKVIPAAEAGGAAWRAELPLADLPPGTHGLLIRAVDRTGNVSRTHRELVTVLSPEEMAARQLAATSPVTGVTLFGESAVPGADVVLMNDKQEIVGSARANERGEFEFPPMPAGKYTVTAEALVKNKIRSASAEVTVPEPPLPLARVSLQLR